MSGLDMKKTYRGQVTNTLARFFKVSKDQLRTDVDLEDVHSLLEFPSLHDVAGFRAVIQVAHIQKLKLEEFFYGKKFLKSDMYAEFLNGEAQAGDDKADFLFVAHINGELFAIYRSDSYDGIGGIFVECDDGSDYGTNGFCIEPFEHFLKSTYSDTDQEMV